jgi:hypothetical protein
LTSQIHIAVLQIAATIAIYSAAFSKEWTGTFVAIGTTAGSVGSDATTHPDLGNGFGKGSGDEQEK